MSSYSFPLLRTIANFTLTPARERSSITLGRCILDLIGWDNNFIRPLLDQYLTLRVAKKLAEAKAIKLVLNEALLDFMEGMGKDQTTKAGRHIPVQLDGSTLLEHAAEVHHIHHYQDHEHSRVEHLLAS